MKPSREVIRHGRREVGRVPVLLRALKILDDAKGGEVWAWGGLGVAMWRLMSGAQGRAGRDLIDIVYMLHQKLGLNAGGEVRASEAAAALEPFEPWLSEVARDARGRGVLMNWVDLFSERLTMHRYGDAAHRRRQAQGLLAAPVKLVFNLDAQGAAGLTEFAELVLRFWDLTQAEKHIQYGWNRLLPEGEAAMGGFYGLADQARIPDAGEILAAVRVLKRDVRGWSGAVGPGVGAWVAAMRDEMVEDLEKWERTGEPPKAATGLFGGLRRLLGRGRGS